MKEINIGYDNVILEFSVMDLMTMINSINVACEEIEEWEFFIRLGISPDDIQKISNSLAHIREIAMKR